jgi:hypothetical protein
MKTRENKKHETRQRQEQCRLQNKARLERALSAIGLLTSFRALPAAVRNEALKKLPSIPEVCIEPSAVGCRAAEQLKKNIDLLLQESSEYTTNGRIILLSDILLAGSVPIGFRSLLSAPLSKKQKLIIKDATLKAEIFLKEKLAPALEWLWSQIMISFAIHSRIDQGILQCIPNKTPGVRPENPLFRLNISCHEPRAVSVEIDGRVRRAYQYGLSWRDQGIRWSECNGELVDLDHGRKYPIFIQAHGLQRLRERLPFSMQSEAFVNFTLLESLNELSVVERKGKGFLIELRLRGYRIGYLVAQVAQDKIVVTTFLFLTMKGTPEYRLLEQKLRLSRQDIEHMGLDSITTFLSPDVRADESLTKVLEECGCGSLLALGRDLFHDRPASNSANELKRFLGILAKDHQKLS